MSSTVVDAEHKISPIPEGGLKIPFWLNFIHPCLEILGNVKEFVKKQLSKSKKSFKYDEDACSSSDDEERILAESDQYDDRKIRESNEPPEQSSKKQFNKENCKSNNEQKKEMTNIDY